MTTTLYFSPQPTRSARARWAFLETEIPFEARPIDVFAGEQNAPEYLEVNPLGIVPTAVFGDTPIIESSALALAAAIEHPEHGLVPPVGSDGWRQALQWSVFAPAELDHHLVTLNQQRLFLAPDARDPQVRRAAEDALAKRINLVLDRLGEQPFLLGETFSVADICVGHSFVWAHFHGLADAHPRMRPYLERLQTRPAFPKVYGPTLQVIPDPHAA
jgi:glutathione S-transferase